MIEAWRLHMAFRPNGERYKVRISLYGSIWEDGVERFSFPVQLYPTKETLPRKRIELQIWDDIPVRLTQQKESNR